MIVITHSRWTSTLAGTLVQLPKTGRHICLKWNPDRNVNLVFHILPYCWWKKSLHHLGCLNHGLSFNWRFPAFARPVRVQPCSFELWLTIYSHVTLLTPLKTKMDKFGRRFFILKGVMFRFQSSFRESTFSVFVFTRCFLRKCYPYT